MPSNPEQKKAIEHRNGPCLVLAGPGSGKTFVITNRIRYLIQQYNVPPENILVVTFTKAAAAQMQTRFMKLMHDVYTPVSFGTFHAVFYSILRNTSSYHSFKLISQHEKNNILQDIILSVCPNQEIDQTIYACYLSEISRRKNRLSILNGPTEKKTEEEKQMDEICSCYMKAMKQQKLLDFDDMAAEVCQLFQNCPEILKDWQSRYPYIMIDEFQDINEIQYEVIKLLAGKEKNLFAVGDDDQAIYGFRGSDPAILFRFQNEFKEITTLILHVNYRSNDEIVQSSQKLICHNKNRFVKNMHAVHEERIDNRTENKTEVLQKVWINGYQKNAEMQNAVIQVIREKSKEIPIHEIAVICRTNHMASEIAELLYQNAIPYHTNEKLNSLYEHFIIEDLMAYLSLAYEQLSRENLYRIMNKPKRYLSRRCVRKDIFTFDEIMLFYKEKSYVTERVRKLNYLLEKVRHLPLSAGIHLIRKWGGYEEYLNCYGQEHHDRFEDLYDVLERFTQKASEFQTFGELKAYIRDFLNNQEDRSEEVQKDGVRILTYHGAKGLEFNTVLLPQVNEGIVPHKKDASVEEERRMFYVAMTRAKDTLWILYLMKTKESKNYPSRFIGEIKRLTT